MSLVNSIVNLIENVFDKLLPLTVDLSDFKMEEVTEDNPHLE